MRILKIALISSLFQVVALACSCSVVPTAERLSFEPAKKVFIGKVLSAVNLSPNQKEFTFEVSSVFKGEPTKITKLLSSFSGNCDESDFVAGHEYIIFAYIRTDGVLSNQSKSNEQTWGTNPCMGTIDMSFAEARKMLEELRILAKERKPK